MQLLRDKVILITGAGRGIGRAHALFFAAQGARLVVNDLGAEVTGEGSNRSLADGVVAEVKELGADAIANYDDISDWQGASRAVYAGISAFGRLDGLVNNAGNLRTQEIADLAEGDFDSIIKVHVKGSFGCTRHALSYWRSRFRDGDHPNASIVNTISEALLIGYPGCVTYGAAKAAISQLTTCGSREALKYGVRINAYSPRASTRMAAAATVGTERSYSADEIKARDPTNTSPLVAWLLSNLAQHVSGQIFRTDGGAIAKCIPWSFGEFVRPPQAAARFAADEVGLALNASIFGSRFPDFSLPRGYS